MGSPTSNTDQLIDRLAADVAPVRRLIDPRRRAARWAAFALAIAAVGVVYYGLRRDLGAALSAGPILLRLPLLAATMWLAAVAALRVSVPGAGARAWTRWWPLLLLGALLAITAAELLLAGDTRTPMRGWACVRKMTFVGLVPAVGALVLVYRAAPLEPIWAAVLALVAAGAAGALTSELACPLGSPMHVLLWHVLPIAVYAGLGAAAIAVVVRLRRR